MFGPTASCGVPRKFSISHRPCRDVFGRGLERAIATKKNQMIFVGVEAREQNISIQDSNF